MQSDNVGQRDASPRHQIFAKLQISDPGSACPWDYTDVCVFLICVVALGAFLQLAIPLHILNPCVLREPPALLQTFVLVWVLLALYVTLKIRRGGAIWRALGWTLPSRRYLLGAILAGILWGRVVSLVAQSASPALSRQIPLTLFALAVTLGPVAEESFFRGCLLPLVARTSSVPVAVILTALVFAFFHQPPTLLQCACFAVSGILYGGLRVASGSTTSAALMHCAYNLTLFACQRM